MTSPTAADLRRAITLTNPRSPILRGPAMRYWDDTDPLAAPYVMGDTVAADDSDAAAYVLVRAVGWGAVSLVADQPSTLSPSTGPTIYGECFAIGSVAVTRDLTRLPLRVEHDRRRVAGVARWARTGPDGFLIVYEMTESAEARDVYAGLKAGALSLSVGFRSGVESTYDLGDLGKLRVHERDARIHEVSVTTSPAHQSAAALACVRYSTFAHVRAALGLDALARRGQAALGGVEAVAAPVAARGLIAK